MKIPALPILLLAVLLAAWPARHASAQEASFDLFYTSLADDGDWYNTPDFGYVWHPAIADGSDKWRPYADGYWAQTDDGWAWVSYESFGWATYHYGRWIRLRDIGWAWVPGYQWGPGWVSWRTSEDYVGWAPLPPREGSAGATVSVDYNSVEAPDDGYTASVDQDYDIGPDNYCFVGVRQFGAPVLREVILPPQRNIILIGNTINVTNIYYRRGPDRTVVYNTGPNIAFIDAHVERPIQRLRINRREDVAYLHESGRGGNPTVVRNGVLLVAAPVIARRAVNFEQVKPTRIKQTIAQPQVVHGWTNAGGNEAQVAQLREQVKSQAQAAPRQARAEMPAPGVAPAEPAAADLREHAPAAPANAQKMEQVDAARTARRENAQREQAARDEARQANPVAPVKAAVPTAEQGAARASRAEAQEERQARKRAQAQEKASMPAPTKAQAPAPEEEQAPHPAVRQNRVPDHAERQAPPRASQPAQQGDEAEREAYRNNRQQQLQAQQAQHAQQAQQAAQPAQQAQQAAQAARRAERPTAPAAPEKGNSQPNGADDKKKQPNN